MCGRSGHPPGVRAMGRRTAIIGAVCLVTICLVVTYAAIRDKAKFSTQAENEARARKGKIQAEIKGLGEHPWAGEYYEGDGLGVGISLSLAPESGFVFEWHGCMGVYDRNYGELRRRQGSSLLH